MKKINLIFIFSVIIKHICFSQVADNSKITDISVDTIGNIKWMAFSPNGFIAGQIEMFRENKWDTVYQYSLEPIIGIGNEGGRVKESTKIELRHGINRIRIKITAPYTFTSEEIIVLKKALEIDDYNPIKVKDHLTFSQQVSYEFYDKKLKSVLKGVGTVVDLSTFKKGTYYLRADSSEVLQKVIKK